MFVTWRKRTASTKTHSMENSPSFTEPKGTTEYSWELSVQPVKTKWNGTVLDLIIMLNGTFTMLYMLADSNQHGWHFIREFSLKLHREFMFWGTHGHSARVAVYTGALSLGLDINLRSILILSYAYVSQVTKMLYTFLTSQACSMLCLSIIPSFGHKNTNYEAPLFINE
jgi:hypothetical protein